MAALFLFATITTLLATVSSTTIPNEDQSKEQDVLNVLLVSVPQAGHMNSLLVLGEELVARGHNVTMSSTENWFEAGKKSKDRGFNYVSSGPFVYENETDFRNRHFYQKEMLNSNNPLIFCQGMLSVMNMVRRFTDEHLINLIENHDLGQWDIIVVDFFSATLACSALTQKVPIVVIADTSLTNLSPWSHPALFSRLSDNLNFIGRLRSSTSYILYAVIGLDYAQSFLKFSGHSLGPLCKEVLPSYSVLAYPVLVRTVIGLDYPEALQPLTTHLGPILSKHSKPLQSDLVQWLADKGSKSVIYISMGSIGNIDASIAKALIDGISQTKYSVIWALSKTNQRVISDIDIDTQRFFISNWISQVTLLQHSSISIALFHGGANGVNEALKFGVPLVVVPQMGDQYDWAVKVESAGVGLQIPDLRMITTSQVKEIINKIDSGNYREKAQKMKLIMKAAGGVDKGCDLIEFYAKVGYDHLLPAPVKYKWNWIQYYNLDIKLCFIIIFATCLIFFLNFVSFAVAVVVKLKKRKLLK